MSKKGFVRLLAALYAAAVLLCAAGQLLWVKGMTQAEPRSLSVQEAQLSSIRTDYGAKWLDYTATDILTTDNDARLVWTVREKVSGLRVCIQASRPVDDVELYYTTAPGQEYSLERRLSPVHFDAERGEYTFRLPKAVRVESLRLDPTSTAGCFLKLKEIHLNPPLTLREKLLPAAPELLCVAFAPPLMAFAVRELLTMIREIKYPKEGPAAPVSRKE
ncbi:MAG: hypothetical protein IJ412_01825 [Oscillospiraceae bacterium]|nr:hypothetical protein [Oscillospiraceae bacterium]